MFAESGFVQAQVNDRDPQALSSVCARQDKDVGTLPTRPYGKTKDDGKCSFSEQTARALHTEYAVITSATEAK